MVVPLAGETAISAKRAELAGKPGIYGLISNKKTSAIGLFASLGGLVYGYNQGMFAQVLTMHSFTVAVCLPKSPITSRFVTNRIRQMDMLRQRVLSKA